jgi:polyisoprenoid-binding protein YceI
MTTRRASGRVVATLSSVVCCALSIAAASTALAARYDIDPIETKTTYETKYLGFIAVRGNFERMTGTLNYEPTKPVGERDPSIHVIIDATTLVPTTFDSEAKRRMLRGPEFFNVDHFSTIEFKSQKFRYDGDKLIAIDGNITLLGVTKPVTLTVSKSSCEPAVPPRGARCTASTEVTVKRFEFGMKGWSGTVSDDVKIAVELVAVAAGDEKAKANSPPAKDAKKSELPQ